MDLVPAHKDEDASAGAESHHDAMAQWFSPARATRFMSRRAALWVGFGVVHLGLCLLALLADGMPLGDVTLVYKMWAQHAVADQFIVGIDGGWVYPIVAFIPIIAAAALGFAAYDFTWLTIVVIVNATAFAALIGREHQSGRLPRRHVAWWWLGFLALLGPIAVGRIDSITVPLVVIALLWLGERPRAAAAVLTVATWIKVWPAAVIAAVIIAAKHRWQVLVTAAATSLGIILIALSLGGARYIFSFVTQQTGRGLQIEAPASSFWLWRGVFGDIASSVYYDTDMLTYQVAGPGADVASTIMTPLLGLAVLIVLLLGVRAARSSRSFTTVLPALVLALVTTLIAFNKVGSPQFVAWLAAPVIIGLVLRGKAFRTPAVLTLLVAAFTQIVYPYWYGYLLNLDAPMVAVLTLRNLLYFVIVGWAVHALWNVREQSEV